jgi:hypothetical protein
MVLHRQEIKMVMAIQIYSWVAIAISLTAIAPMLKRFIYSTEPPTRPSVAEAGVSIAQREKGWIQYASI